MGTIKEQVQALLAKANLGTGAKASSRLDGQIVCYKCRKAPGTLVHVPARAKMQLGLPPGSDPIYQCQGSCSWQGQQAFLSTMKRAKKKKAAEARSFNRLVERARDKKHGGYARAVLQEVYQERAEARREAAQQ